MTPQEAIKILEVAKAECEWNAPLDYQEAFDMAISALQAQEEPKSPASGSVTCMFAQKMHDRPTDGLISRQEAIDALCRRCDLVADDDEPCTDKCNDIKILEKMPSAQPESARTFVELVVEYPDPELCTYKEYKGKPYYSIKYIENGETYVGYGTYKPEVLSQFLKEYFISSAQPEIIRCKDCKYWQDQEEGIVEVPICARPQNKYEKFPLVMLIDGDGFCSYAERRADETY